jgi:preprotein translocase subunit SecG|tara:strand:+ start:350 stop:508 length:159 start_codon:yes stop_codon:yes gene_type:complete
MKKFTVLCLLIFFTIIVSCDYSSYRKSKDAEKEKKEEVTQEKTDGGDTAKEK